MYLNVPPDGLFDADIPFEVRLAQLFHPNSNKVLINDLLISGFLMTFFISKFSMFVMIIYH